MTLHLQSQRTNESKRKKIEFHGVQSIGKTTDRKEPQCTECKKLIRITACINEGRAFERKKHVTFFLRTTIRDFYMGTNNRVRGPLVSHSWAVGFFLVYLVGWSGFSGAQVCTHRSMVLHPGQYMWNLAGCTWGLRVAEMDFSRPSRWRG